MAGIKKGTVLGKWSEERKAKWFAKRYPTKPDMNVEPVSPIVEKEEPKI